METLLDFEALVYKDRDAVNLVRHCRGGTVTTLKFTSKRFMRVIPIERVRNISFESLWLEEERVVCVTKEARGKIADSYRACLDPVFPTRCELLSFYDISDDLLAPDARAFFGYRELHCMACCPRTLQFCHPRLERAVFSWHDRQRNWPELHHILPRVPRVSCLWLNDCFRVAVRESWTRTLLAWLETGPKRLSKLFLTVPLEVFVADVESLAKLVELHSVRIVCHDTTQPLQQVVRKLSPKFKVAQRFGRSVTVFALATGRSRGLLIMSHQHSGSVVWKRYIAKKLHNLFPWIMAVAIFGGAFICLRRCRQ